MKLRLTSPHVGDQIDRHDTDCLSDQHVNARGTKLRRVFDGVLWFGKSSFCVASLIAILAVLSAIPLLQLIAFGYLLDVAGRLTRGGRLRHYLWPQPKRFCKESWRWSTWKGLPDRLWDFTTAWEIPRLFWLGTRGAVGTLVWLIPGMVIIAANREGETGLAGLVGGLSLIAMGVALLYLPMLQANFAAEDRLSAMFEVRKIRQDFKCAPWAWLTAMLLGLVVLPVPLYLLKVEATPREVTWLPCVVFVAFILPARIAEGLALRRARKRIDEHGNVLIPQSRWATFSRFIARLMMLVVVGTYLVFLTISQFTSWDGLPTWVEQHAILFPRPFTGGV